MSIHNDDDEDGEDGEDEVYAFKEWVKWDCYILIDTSHDCFTLNDGNVKVTTYLPI